MSAASGRALVAIGAPLRDALDRGAVLTPTRRLAREIAHAQSLGGEAAPSTAEHLEAFFERCYAEAREAGVPGAQAVLLPPDIVPLAMAEAVPDRAWLAHLDTFAEAWRLACRHGIPSSAPRLGDTENGRAYRRWARAFEALAAQRGWLTGAELPDRLVRLIDGGGRWRPPPAAAFGLDAPTPAEERFLVAAGVPRLALPRAAEAAALQVAHLADERRELATAALWARERASAEPEARIGVLVAELGGAFPAIERRFHAFFADAENPSDYVNVSGGVALCDEPLCRDALELLAFATGGCDGETLRALAHSPFLRLEPPPTALGAVRLVRARDLAGRGANRRLRALAAAAAGSADSEAARMAQLLAIAGWGRGGRDSREAQARIAFERCLQMLAEAERLLGPMRGAAAVAALRRIAARRLFAPHAQRAPIQVLGRRESIGLAFDHLWIAGLGADRWPPVPSPNPLLPLSVQRAAGVAGLGLDQEIDRARRMMRLWRCAAPHVVASHAGDAGGAAPLLAGFAPVDAARLVQRPELAAGGHPWAAARRVAVQREADAAGTALPASERQVGGAAVLKDQSLCPFRAWARHRLGVREARAADRFPDAAERGTVVHEVLRELAQRLPDRDALAGADAAAIDAAIAAVLDDRQRWPERYRSREAARLKALIAQWLAREAERAPFAVAAVEQSVAADIAGLRLDLRIDRIDAVAATADATGGMLLIDYKTGTAGISAWQTPRPADPQLPLYALAVGTARGIAFARLRPGECALLGIADSAAIGDLPARGATDAAGFDALLDDWRSALGDLARAFQAGDARTDPAAPGVCRQCHLHALCRVFE